MSNMKFKIGDRVRVVGKYGGNWLPLGTEVVILLVRAKCNDYQCQNKEDGSRWYCREEDLAPIEEPAQHYIYLGRIDGKLWLAGPTDQERPEIDSRLIHQSIPYQIKKEAEVGIFMQHLATLPRIEYLGQETDFQMYQAVRDCQEVVIEPCCRNSCDGFRCKDGKVRAVAERLDWPKPKLAPEEPAATIQAIREATNRATQSPEAAREFLQGAGIEGQQTFKVYELDFGDTNFLSEKESDITDWIETDLRNMKDEDELNYTITIRRMTRQEIEELPEWN